MFNEYPYRNLTDVNLDYILKHIKDLATNLQDFIKLNTIKYADPIDWNISKQYEANTVVVNDFTGVAYLSTKPVPSGVDVTNTEYWTPIFTLDFVNLNKNITLRNDENNNNATFASATGDWLIVGGQLYKVIQDIALHTAYIVGYNIQVYSVELFVKDYLNQVLNLIGDLDDLTTSDKTSVVNAINSVLSDLNTKIGDLQDLDTSDKTSIVNAINSVLSDLNTKIGDLQELDTEDKTSVVNAINSVLSDLNTKIGDLRELDTEDKTSLVNAINEVFNQEVDLHYITPQMFGAVGDGVTDDTTAFQDAINSIPDGGMIFIPMGKYIIGNLTYTYKIEFAGAGMGKTILKHNTTGTMFTNLTNHALFSIHDMSIEGFDDGGVIQNDTCIEILENTAGNDANDNYMLDIVPPTPHAQAKYNHFYNLFITRFGTAIFNFYYNFYTVMENINIYDCNIGLRNVNTDSMFSKITIENCHEYGLWESGSANKWSDVKVTWCQSNNVQFGAIYISGNNNSMANIEAQENHHNGFCITGQFNQLTNCVSDGNNYANDVGDNYGFYIEKINFLKNCIVTSRLTGNTVPAYIIDTSDIGEYDIKTPTNISGSNIDTLSDFTKNISIYVENSATEITIEGSLIYGRYLAMIHGMATNGSDVINNLIHINCYGGTAASIVNAGGSRNFTLNSITETNGRVTLKISGMINNTFNQFTVSGLTNVKIY